MAMSTCCQVRGIPTIHQGGLERESANMLGVACGCQSQCSQLGHREKGEKDILGLTDTLCLVTWGPKEPTKFANFSISLKKMMSASML